MNSLAGSGSKDGFPMGLVCALTGAVAVAHLLGLLVPSGNFWGVDSYAFLDPRVFIVAVLALLVITAFLLRSPARRPPPPAPAGPEGSRASNHFWIHPVLAAAGAVLFGLFHASHVLLGDGVVLVTTLPLEKTFHPLEPLSLFLEQVTYDAVAPLLTRPGREPYEVAWIGAGALSVLAGAVFLPVVWALAGHLARRVPGATPGRLALTCAVFLALAAQGYVQVFFGYVEVYALSATSIAIYALTSMRFLDDRKPLWPAAAALASAVSLHLSAIVLAPTFVLLAIASFNDPARRSRRARDAVFSASALAALPLLLALLGRGYNLGETLISLMSTTLTKQPEPIPGYFWSWRHARDVVNEQLLIGPLAIAFFVPVAFSALRRKALPALERAFFLAFGAGFAVLSLVVGDSNLGYARNWDLLAPAGFALAIAGMGLLLPRFQDLAAARACMLIAVAGSLFHTIPWIGVNAASHRALQRFVTLPLELGRMESTVGYWFSLQGDAAQAERWYLRALYQYPGNVRANVNLGDLYIHRGDYRRASQAYRAAIVIRPESDEYRLRLIGALVRAGTPSQAVPEIERLVRRQPHDPRIWTVYGIVLLGTARTEAARQAFDAARKYAPYSLLYRMMVNYADLPHGFERAIEEVWGVLIGM